MNTTSIISEDKSFIVTKWYPKKRHDHPDQTDTRIIMLEVKSNEQLSEEFFLCFLELVSNHVNK